MKFVIKNTSNNYKGIWSRDKNLVTDKQLTDKKAI